MPEVLLKEYCGRALLCPTNCVLTLSSPTVSYTGGTDSVIHQGEGKEEIKTRCASSSPHRLGARRGASGAVPSEHQAPALHPRAARPPGTTVTTSTSVPRAQPAPRPRARPGRPAPLSPPPLSARSCARAWICLPALPNFGTFHSPTHVGHRPPRVRGRNVRRPWGEECARRGSSPLGGEEARSPLRYRTHPGRPPSWC